MSVPACVRTGRCCETILIPHSPRLLREDYATWVNQGPDFDQKLIRQDIWIIYPMLAGRCKGKRVRPDGTVRYVYGPCKNLGYKDGLAECTIQEHKPGMCSGYPYYEDAPYENAGTFKGCGYNVDPNNGIDAKDLQLVPLTPEEI